MATALAVAALALLPAPPALAGGESRDFRIRTKEYKFQSVPSALRPGIHTVSNDNHGEEPHVLFVFRLNAAHEDDSEQEILAGLRAGPPAAFASEYTTGPVGHVFSLPGEETAGPIDLSAGGRYVYFCPILTPADGGPRERHFNLGMIGFIKTRP